MLERVDPEIYNIIQKEIKRQQNVIEPIPSENFASLAVLQALGSVLTNKYSEGYSHKRYMVEMNSSMKQKIWQSKEQKNFLMQNM